MVAIVAYSTAYTYEAMSVDTVDSGYNDRGACILTTGWF